MDSNTPKHFMRYAIHSEAQYFKGSFRDSYGGIVLNGNLAAYSLNGVCSFLSDLLVDKPYFIDPITHAFGHHPQSISRKDEETGQLVPRAAIVSLGKRYGEAIATYIDTDKGIFKRERGLTPEDFTEELKVSFTEHVLDFQEMIISSGLEEKGDAKYLDMESKLPCFLIAPYFYMGANSVDIWLDLNLRFIDIATKANHPLPMFAEILISNDAFIDPEVRNNILTRYSESNANGVVLWVEGFSEHSASKQALLGYRKFVEEIVAAGKSVVIMYGGYYSIILSKFGPISVCHGPGYGEEREVTPVGGGLPKPKYYYPAMHKRLPHREVAFALSGSTIQDAESFYENVCKCQMCQEVVGIDLKNFALYGESKSGIRKDGVAFEYATSVSKKISTAHYLHRKRLEFEFVQSNSVDNITKDLNDSYTICRDLFGVTDAAHLSAWRDALMRQIESES